MAAKCRAAVDGIGPAPVPVCPLDNVKLQVSILVHQTLENSSRIQIQHDIVTLDTREDINRSQLRVSSPLRTLTRLVERARPGLVATAERLRAIATQIIPLVSRHDRA